MIQIFGINFNQIENNLNISILDALKLLFKQIYELNSNLQIQINSITYDMIHFAFPQYNQKKQLLNKTVQVDILLTKYPEFCKFYMYSPTEIQSKYKGAHRNELLRAIAYILSFEIIKTDENNNPLIWKQNDLSSSGFYTDIKTLIDQNGNKLKYKDTDEDLIPAYAKVIKTKNITHNPKEVINLLVGPQFSQSDINSFEKLFNIIKNNEKFIHIINSVQILEQCAKSIKENDKLVFPIQLEIYI